MKTPIFRQVSIPKILKFNFFNRFIQKYNPVQMFQFMTEAFCQLIFPCDHDLFPVLIQCLNGNFLRTQPYTQEQYKKILQILSKKPFLQDFLLILY